MIARDLRDAAAASDHLQALYVSLLAQGNELDAAIVHHCGEALSGVLGRIVVGRVEPVEVAS